MVDLKYYLQMADVRRCSGVKLIRPYDLIRHSYMVTVMFQHFAKIENVEYDVDALNMIMRHDILEVKTGDLLNPVKSFNNGTKSAWNRIEKHIITGFPEFSEYSDERIREVLNHEQHNLFKVCDYLELWTFIVEEILLGNRTEGVLKIYFLVKDDIEKFGFESVTEFMKEFLNGVEL
jgi:5'-deoxynucleotidase YfbR-like HD superfamily hydrolase